ncbi:hypothetical protein LX64_04932 [Chitinophaga skermanii]|uniref:N-acetyltransferase domain-containing protein n=1 Tax=Chitinophaga skermanii TaxID=331697 RepID=A0A327Q3X9_9BACT|nr:N-acetyltransferase [Chitinophaga skermanii]RAI97882.1 hypothetical protein LX64_04932 [Chitinophaga skermanii]
METPFQVVNNETNLQFEVDYAGEKAVLVYRYYKQRNIAFMHTVVPGKLEGQGIASALAKAAFAFAAEQKKLVMVYCPFVAGYVKKHPEYLPQLDPQYRVGVS